MSNEKIITKEMLNPTKKEPIVGVILCSSYDVKQTKNGGEYIMGSLMAGSRIQFKAWSNSKAFQTLKEKSLTNTTVRIVGEFDDYGGSWSIVLSSITPVEDIPIDTFLPEKYDSNDILLNLTNLIKENVSEKGFVLANAVMFSKQDIMCRFKTEFAGASMHDNCKGGLLAHTYKVVKGVHYIVTMYPELAKSQDMRDLLFLGALFHDIGKIDEMNLGVYSPNSYVTHRFLGIKYFDAQKDYVFENYGDKWYYSMISIFLQHHGEFDDKCRTLAAMIVHKADMLDTEMTMLCQELESPQASPNGETTTIKFDGNYLNVL